MALEATTVPAPVRSDASVQEMLQMMDVVNALRSQEQEVARQLSHDDQVADLRTRLRTTYEQMGVQVDDLTLDRAIRDQFAHKYEFQPPKRDFSYTIAKAYVDRARIGRRYGIPALVLAALGVGAWGLVAGGRLAYQKAQESEVETWVEKAYQERQRLTSAANELSSSPTRANLPSTQTRELNETARLSLQELQDADPFFKQYCDEGTSEDDVTIENYSDALTQLSGVSSLLGRVSQRLDTGKKIIEEQRGLEDVIHKLEATYTAIKTSKAPALFLERANGAYHSGVQYAERRQLAAAQQDLQQLAAVSSDIQQFESLSSTVNQVHGAIKQVVKENGVRQEANALYSEAQQYIAAANVPRLGEAVQKLKGIEAELVQEYKIFIVDRPGVRSGVERDYTKQYIVLEARDTDGNAIPMTMVSEEDGKPHTITRWAERVPREVYEGVKADKMDNSTVDDSFVGEKARGFRTIKYVGKFNLPGQRIVEW